MKWSLFIFILLLNYGCNNKRVATPVSVQDTTPQPASRELTYNDTADMPWHIGPEGDSGYFKGLIPEPLDSIQSFENTPLERALSQMLHQQQLHMLDSETLSNSVFINQQKKIRTDTLRNKKNLLISNFGFGSKEWQKVFFNGKLLMSYVSGGNEEEWGPLFSFNPSSFRHFSFYGKEYYYINANEAYMHGASAGNVYYHFIWDKTNKIRGSFLTCRFWLMLAGDVNGDRQLDYLDFNNDDFCTTVPSSDEVTITLWSSGPAGTLLEQTDKAGQRWSIDARTGDDYKQDSFNIIRSYWPVLLR